MHKTLIRPVVMYGTETWASRKREVELLERTEVRMLWWILKSITKRAVEELRRNKGAGVVSQKALETRLR